MIDSEGSSVTLNDLSHLLTGMNLAVRPLEEDTPLGDDGVGLDSLSIMELSLRIEEEFGCVLHQNTFKVMTTMTAGQLISELTQ